MHRNKYNSLIKHMWILCFLRNEDAASSDIHSSVFSDLWGQVLNLEKLVVLYESVGLPVPQTESTSMYYSYWCLTCFVIRLSILINPLLLFPTLCFWYYRNSTLLFFLLFKDFCIADVNSSVNLEIEVIQLDMLKFIYVVKTILPVQIQVKSSWWQSTFR